MSELSSLQGSIFSLEVRLSSFSILSELAGRYRNSNIRFQDMSKMEHQRMFKKNEIDPKLMMSEVLDSDQYQFDSDLRNHFDP